MNSALNSMKKSILENKKIFRLLLITLAIFTLFSIMNPDIFLSIKNYKSISFQIPELGLLVLAISLAMISGGIDLSVVGTANLSAITAALILTNLLPEDPSVFTLYLYIFIAIISAIIVGGLCGLVNGILVAKLNVPPILATLGTMSLYTGISIVITKGTAIYGFPKQFLFIGNGTIGNTAVPLIIFLVVLAIVVYIFKYMPFGTKLFLVGTNVKAAEYAGLKKDKIIFYTYLFSGILAAIAGIIIIAKTNSAKADFGTSYVLQAILIAILGGVNPDGGEGKFVGILLGLLSVQFLSSGLNMLRINVYLKELAWGVLLISVMILNYFDERKNT